MAQFSGPSTFISKPAIQNPGSASQAISIRTDVPPIHYADIMNPDVPDLTYEYDRDYDFATPHSASSSHMIPTPVFDWSMALGDEIFDAKEHYSPLMDDWHSTSSHLSSPDISRNQCAPDGLDELDWEKQRCYPVEVLPLFPSNSSGSYGSTLPQDGFQYSQRSSYTSQHAPYSSSSSAIHDTLSTSFVHFPPHLTEPSPSASTCPTISPSALNSASTSPHNRLRPQPYPQPPLKLHQPRPSRRIPIISLAELASAGEGMLQQPKPRRQPTVKHATASGYPHPDCPYPRSPLEALSPLPLDCHGFSPSSEKREARHMPTSNMNSYRQPRGPPQLPKYSGSTRFPHPHPSSTVISCSCGCMESFTIQ